MSNDELKDEEKEMHLYLEFGGKFTKEMLKQPVFLRVANLNKEHPLVQLNENVFKGSYNFALGTNLFFEISERESNLEYFDRKSAVSLNHILNETKVVQLQLVKVRPKIAEILKASQKIKYSFQWDYNTLLSKFENGTLDLKDFIKENDFTETEPLPEPETKSVVIVEVKSKDSSLSEEKMDISNDDLNSSIEDKGGSEPQGEQLVTALEQNYEILQKLARKPTKREVINELVTECDPVYREAFEYHNIEKQILQPCDAFFSEKVVELNQDTLSDCVDINRCILYGLLDSSKDVPRILTSEEKRAILTLDNFDNLSLAARYYVLCEQVKRLENIVPSKELSKKDEFGRSFDETLRIYKKLKNAVAKRICDIKSSLKEDDS